MASSKVGGGIFFRVLGLENPILRTLSNVEVKVNYGVRSTG